MNEDSVGQEIIKLLAFTDSIMLQGEKTMKFGGFSLGPAIIVMIADDTPTQVT